jgi:hypothetical protein
MKKEEISTDLSIIILNVKGLHSPIKRHKLAKWIKNKIQLFSMCKKLTSLAETHTD